jgi:hypothetical protein
LFGNIKNEKRTQELNDSKGNHPKSEPRKHPENTWENRGIGLFTPNRTCLAKVRLHPANEKTRFDPNKQLILKAVVKTLNQI